MALQTIHHSTKQIYQMLWELASANSSYRIQEEESNQEDSEIDDNEDETYDEDELVKRTRSGRVINLQQS